MNIKSYIGQTLNCQMVISFYMVKEMLLITLGQANIWESVYQLESWSTC